MGRNKKIPGEWRSRKLTCGVCYQPYQERKPDVTQVGPVERICPKCDQKAMDAWNGKKPVICKPHDEECREWNRNSGWGKVGKDE